MPLIRIGRSPSAYVRFEYQRTRSDGDLYAGTIRVRLPDGTMGEWAFDELRPSPLRQEDRQIAVEACAFGGAYTSDNRGEDTPEWAPSAEVADAIHAATYDAVDRAG